MQHSPPVNSKYNEIIASIILNIKVIQEPNVRTFLLLTKLYVVLAINDFFQQNAKCVIHIKFIRTTSLKRRNPLKPLF